MIKIENVDAYGFEHAIRAMRNPMNSWDKIDSHYCGDVPCRECEYGDSTKSSCSSPSDNGYAIGKADMALMQRLFKAGVEHRTYARMIYVWMDVTAPLYLWKEIDRYTVGKTQVSTSTMHKIHAKEFTLDDFSHEHLLDDGIALLSRTVEELNSWRYIYLNGSAWCEPKDKRVWWQMIQTLPSSYNQKRTLCLSYETIFKIIRERTGHKLDEWRDFIEVMKRELPYVKQIMGEEE